MKKFLVILAVVAMTCMSSLAFAVDITTSGSIDYRMRSITHVDMNSATDDKNKVTNERVRLNIDAKAGSALGGRISIENDWDTWGRFETTQANGQIVTNGTKTAAGPDLRIREAWIAFKVPGAPFGIKAGHQLLQLGNGWFFRSMKFGSDAWVAFTDISKLHLGIVNIKVAENNSWAADDTDAYSFVSTYKLSDTLTAGINFTSVNDRTGKYMQTAYGTAGNTSVFAPAATLFTNAQLQNLEAHVAGTVGPVKLKAEVDLQSGDATAAGGTHKFKGNQIVIEAVIPIAPFTINATLARGSGTKTAEYGNDVSEYVALLDADVHYTLIYEYLVKTAARQSFRNTQTGFANTTAVSLGADFNVTKNLLVGADIWMLQATEKVNYGVAGVADSNDLGIEVDAKVNWKLYENLTWNTTIGLFVPGDAYKTSATADAGKAGAIQSVLSFKF